MANTSKTVEIIFGGVDKTGGAISSVGRNLDSLSNRVGDMTGPLAGISDSILKLDTALAALGVAALAFATKEAVTFEAALIDLQKVMDEGEGEAKDYADQFSELSSRFGVDAGAIIQSTADFRQAGFDIGESLTLVEQSLLAVNAADLTTKQSSELLIGTLAGFQAPASQAANLLDVLNGVSNKAGASVAELGEGFKILSPIANTLGLSFEETAALLTPVVEVTRSGTESANALKTAISNLIKPTKERRDLLVEELGIELELNGERRDTKDVLYDLIDATKGLDENEKQRVATVIAGAEQMSRFLAVLNGAERSEEILQIALASSGSALEEFEVKTQSAEFALKQLRTAFTTAAATAGLEYIDQTKEVTRATTNLVDSFREAVQGDNADVLFDVLRGGLESFAEQVNIIAENLPEAFEGLDFSQLLGAFDGLSDELGDAFEAVFGAVDLSTVEGLESALQKVVDAFTALVNVSSGIISGLEPLFTAIGTGIEEFQDLDEATQKSVGEILGIAKAIDTVLPALGALGTGLGSVGTGLTALAGAQGFKALLGNLDTLKAISATGAGKGGLIGLALAGGYGVGKLINEFVIGPMEDAFGTSIGGWLYEQFNADEIEKIKEMLKPLTEEEKKLAKQTGELRDLNDRLAEKLKNTATASEDTQKAWQDYADELVNAANKHNDLNDAMGGTDDNLNRSTNAIDQLTDKANKNGDALGDVGRTTKELAKNNKDLTLGYDESTGKVNSWSGTIVKSGKSMDDAAQKTKDLVTNTEDYRLELEKIDSNERIKVIEARVALDIAEAEANAEKVIATFDSINTSIDSTGSIISELFGSLGEGSRLDQLDVASQIRKENELREKAFELQEKMTKAQIEEIKARTRQISKGDALIKVDGTGLQPHLEAFMFEILREIQVRVNADGEEMLLGLQ